MRQPTSGSASVGKYFLDCLTQCVDAGGMYIASTAVVMQEAMKLCVCLFILWRERTFDVPATIKFLKVYFQ